MFQELLKVQQQTMLACFNQMIEKRRWNYVRRTRFKNEYKLYKMLKKSLKTF